MAERQFDQTGPDNRLVTVELERRWEEALLRCLIDKVVIHRAARDHVRTRIVWKGGDTTTREVPIRHVG